jgi:hypothetical protein
MIELRKRIARRTGDCSWPLLRPCEVSASGQFHRANGCSGWSRTSTVPGNNREDYCYPTEQWIGRNGRIFTCDLPVPGRAL